MSPAQASAGQPSPVVLERVVDVLGEHTGLAVTGTMRDRLRRCLDLGAEAVGVSTAEYARGVIDGGAPLQRLVDDLTVQESSFFRDPRQLAAFAEHILPGLGGPVRVWSAGCANGQEAYSIAMLLLERGRPDACVIGSDISAPALAVARSGAYSEAGLRGLSARRRAAWLARAGDGWRVRDSVRARVTFVRHNLAAEAPPFAPGHCQVIFCRNVLIYFRHDVLLRTLVRLRDWLPPGGFLFLGFSESLWQVTDVFELVPVGGAFVYRRPDRTPDAEPGRAPDVGPGRAPDATPGPAPDRAPVGEPQPAAAAAPPPASTAAASAPAATPSPAPPSRRADPAAAPTPDGADARLVPSLLRQGELAIAEGDLTAATSAFRQAAYLDPAHPIGHLQLGLVLEADGKPDAAARAFRAARTALRRLDPAVERDLLGYRPEALIHLIDSKLAGRSG